MKTINNLTITSIDDNAHGTTVTGAGSGNGLATGDHKGAAPESDIIIIETDFSKAAHSDELIDTIDYVRIKEIVTTEMAIRSKLIEHVGQRITNQFKSEFPGLIESTVRIRKLNPPIQGTVKEVAIVIKSKR